MGTTRARLGLCGASVLFILTLGVLVAGCTNASSGTSTSATTYYVSPSGNDAAAGTSPANAWRTLAKASSVTLPPGSRLLLQGGQVFKGQLTLGPGDAGRASDPVVVGSYGGGSAKIYSPAGSGSGIYVHDTGGVDIQDLDLIGSSHPGEGDDGISVFNDLPSNHRLNHIVIESVSVTGFLYGIAIGGVHDGAGFRNVRIIDADLYDNIDAGLLTYGPTFDPHSPTYANQNVVVSHVVASRNLGNPHDTTQSTGNGIVLGSVSGGTVIWSTADENGGLGAAGYGPAGIWTYDSTGVDIEHDLSYDNTTPNKVDGNGFGLDQNVSNSLLQYNLSYGNDGTGYLVYSSLNDGWQKNNIVRENISSGDVRDGNTFYGAISIIGVVANVAVYQNTVVLPATSADGPSILRLGPVIRGVSVRNNIFSTEFGPIVAVSRALSVSQVLLQGNDYFSVLGPWEVFWGETTYSSLSDWRVSTSQETSDGIPTGFAVDPEMVGPVLGLSAKSPTATGAIAGFALRTGSPLIGAGLDLSNLGMQPTATDYIGQEEPVLHPDIGAF